ncbi:hypothetical protein ASPBRDRAFT_54624 [Aspergillus brasiliensis CBS 101740]|uniref:Uncharacterized protein n=1 Tax=Aspergillus brasiliensis (strain CBS 101740 / IMI 381727 / IBT 21946) TaxID=767769 RepID=A0A1L9UM85_ASPBC|nr:hypothetical protein ASPBRDRAFT_54624 [Aspergillus brasiliensis CBS 101740]
MAQLSGMPNWQTRRSRQSGLIFVTSDRKRYYNGIRKPQEVTVVDNGYLQLSGGQQGRENSVSRKDIPRCGSSARCTRRTAPGQSGKMTAINVVGQLGKLHGGKQSAEDKAQVSQGWLIDGLKQPDRMERHGMPQIL